MILPETYTAALLLAILSLICWGSWANSYKLAGKWRFELYYWDYAIGALLAVTVAAFTFGTLGFDGFLFTDDLMRAGKHNMLYGFITGGIFNLGNMLLVAAISVAGMSVAFPLGMGLALIIGVVWSYLVQPLGNPALLFGGAAIVLAAMVLASIAHRSFEPRPVGGRHQGRQDEEHHS